MRAKLVALTQPLIRTVDDSRQLTAEEFIIYTARVSNPNNQLAVETSERLMMFLLRQNPKHISPFEQVTATIEIETSRAIAAQLLRHWSLRFQEFSQRYAEATSVEPLQLRMKGATNRQGSLEDAPEHLQSKYQAAILRSFATYQELLEEGVAPESARFVLPLSTRTTMYVTGNVRSFITYFDQRCCEHAQKEHRELAMLMRQELIPHFPLLAQHLNWQA